MGATTDYLVVGAGAQGLAFTDALVAGSDATVTIVDKRPAPGGHWRDAYPFVRLHQPSAYYGVTSKPLGANAVDEHGHYERATGPEVVAYLEEVLADLEATGRVRFLPGHEHLGDGRVRALSTGEVTDLAPARAVVDATYLQSEVPATHTPSFEVADGVRLVPAGGVVDVQGPVARWVVLGAGKTAFDTVVWLLEHDVDPDQVTWVRPQEPWLIDRAWMQPLDRVGELFAGFAREIEAAAHAGSADDLLLRMEAAERVMRIDPALTPTVYRGPIVSQAELAQLRRVDDVIRLGRVRRVEPDRLVLERGEHPLEPGTVVVDCTAKGITDRPAQPIWEPGKVTLQQIRMASPCFNAALIGFLESTDRDQDEKNRLAPTHRYAQYPREWCLSMLITHQLPGLWNAEPDLAAWVATCRLDILHGLPDRLGDPAVQEAMARYATHLGPALANLQHLVGPPAS